MALKTVIKPNGHKAYVLFSNVVQVIPREQVGIGRRKREVPVDEPDDLCPLHASGRRTHELDDFVGQVMAAITRQLGADSSALRLLNLEQNTVTVELLFQDGRVMSSAEAKYPECWRSLSLDEQRVVTFLYRPSTLASRPMIVADDYSSWRRIPL